MTAHEYESQRPNQMQKFFSVGLKHLDASLDNLRQYQEGTIEEVSERQIRACAQRAEIDLNAMYRVLQEYQHQVDSFYATTGIKRK